MNEWCVQFRQWFNDHASQCKVLQGERVPSAALASRMSRLGLKPGMMKVEVA